MVLNILLSLLIVILVTIFTLIFIWWVKYGKKMFEIFTKMQKTFNQTKNPINPNGKMDINSLFNELNKINNTFKNQKNQL